MAKISRLSKAVDAAKRERADDELGPLVEKITAGVANLIKKELKQNPDRTDEILSALGEQDSTMTGALEQIAKIEIPSPTVEIDLAPFMERIDQLEKKLADMNVRVEAQEEVTWVFEHKRDSRGKMTETIAKPVQ